MKRIEYFSAKKEDGIYEFNKEYFGGQQPSDWFHSSDGGRFELILKLEDYPDVRFFIYHNEKTNDEDLENIKAAWKAYCPE
ncbi:hypothetical protein ACINWC743_1798 [Acinetobacter sp. WC-743]|uniref:hypothetical protein n=1 Tax=Acinetobacter TaxID=469 RepID=UPI0002AECD2E|nr:MULTISPECIES: hypothetical protein [Acinetobacter]ELW90973.1 hypothetical protein ACINWC743_1798 [Acinetobacter sp. WC-743]